MPSDSKRPETGAGRSVAEREERGRAARKTDRVAWVQGDGARLPFVGASFDYVSNQFSFHHVRDKASMLHEVFRLLRTGGRFVMTNIAPREMPGWAVYRYFPEAWERDLADFTPPKGIELLLEQVGFARIETVLDHSELEQDLESLAQADLILLSLRFMLAI